MKKLKDPWFVYVLECLNGKLYTGITNNLEKRFQKHSAGKGAQFTRINRPRCMIGAICVESRSEATKLEYTVKNLTAQQKRVLALTWPLTKDLPKL